MAVYAIPKKFAFLWMILLFFISFSFSQQNWAYPPALKTDVAFWKMVFTEYNQDQYIIHDSENLGIIYKIVTFDSSYLESAREEHLKQMKHEIELTLLHLARQVEDSLPPVTHLEKYIMNQFGENVHPLRLRNAARNIRTQQGMRDQFRAGLSRSLAYLPAIEEIFQEADLPRELAYLPHIESSFHPQARSKVGATGIWQFMKSTARLYLKVNDKIDERYDILASTQAAAKLLRYNYEQLGEWGLAITAYNFGLNGMKKAVSIHGSDYMKVRESFNHRNFKFASRNFYPEFLAVIEIMENHQTYFPDITPAPIPQTIRYRLTSTMKFPQIAKLLDIELGELRKLNPAYTSKVTTGHIPIPAGYWVYLPVDTDLTRLENNGQQEKVINLASRAPQPTPENKTNQKSVVSPPMVKQKLTDKPVSPLSYKKPEVIPDNLILVDQSWSSMKNNLLPPVAPSEIMAELRQNLPRKLTMTDDYIYVFANETLGHFADWLRVPLSHLQDINHLGRKKIIYQGQKLRLDFSRVTRQDFYEKRLNFHFQILNGFFAEKVFVNCQEIRINAGESVWKIARHQYQVPVEIIQYFNIDTDFNQLHPGDRLRIPIFQTNKLLEEML